jgi:hypothetical protein
MSAPNPLGTREGKNMKTMIRISLAVNILVLIPIVFGMAIGSPIIDRAWGEFSESRGILASIYFALLVLSSILIVKTIPVFVVPLLATQVIYKITTPFTVGTMLNPVVISNLGIAALHLVTLWVIYKNLDQRAIKKI